MSERSEETINQNSVVHIPTDQITSALFSDKLEQHFDLVAGDYSLSVTLVTCQEKPDSAHPNANRTPFSLVFRTDVDDAHPLQNAIEFRASMRGLERGPLDDLMVYRTLRPVRMPEGAYYQVMFG